MSQVIRIPADIYSRLERLAVGFDTPANVIEKLLDHYEGIDKSAPGTSSVTNSRTRDKTKYIFNGNTYGKGRLVLAIVKKYAVDNPSITYDKLVGAFPKILQGPIGTLNRYVEVEEKYRGQKIKRHFFNSEDRIHLADCEAVVSTEWGAGNIDDFIQAARSYGYTIEPISN